MPMKEAAIWQIRFICTTAFDWQCIYSHNRKSSFKGKTPVHEISMMKFKRSTATKWIISNHFLKVRYGDSEVSVVNLCKLRLKLDIYRVQREQITRYSFWARLYRSCKKEKRITQWISFAQSLNITNVFMTTNNVKTDPFKAKAPTAITNLLEYDFLLSHLVHIVFRK